MNKTDKLKDFYLPIALAVIFILYNQWHSMLGSAKFELTILFLFFLASTYYLNTRNIYWTVLATIIGFLMSGSIELAIVLVFFLVSIFLNKYSHSKYGKSVHLIASSAFMKNFAKGEEQISELDVIYTALAMVALLLIMTRSVNSNSINALLPITYTYQ